MAIRKPSRGANFFGDGMRLLDVLAAEKFCATGDSGRVRAPMSQPKLPKML